MGHLPWFPDPQVCVHPALTQMALLISMVTHVNCPGLSLFCIRAAPSLGQGRRRHFCEESQRKSLGSSVDMVA